MKNQRTRRKLTLGRESIRRLTEGELPKVDGGARSVGTLCATDCAATTCVTGCATCQTCYGTCIC